MFGLTPPISEKPTDDRPHILVVDDDPLFRSLIVAVLRKDYRVTVANDGTDGFHKALDDKPDVTVLDLQMPGWDGLKTLQTFRTHPWLADATVMVLTSDSSRETVLAAIHTGADDYAIKTAFSRDEFRAKLERLLTHPHIVATSHRILPSRAAALTRGDEDVLDATQSADQRRIGWSGSENVLQDIIDAWD